MKNTTTTESGTTIKVDNHFLTRFESYAEALAFIQDRPRNKGADNSSDSADATGNWYGTKTMAEAKKLAVSGWHEGTQIVSQFAEHIAERVDKAVDIRKKTKVELSYVGNACNVGRLASGQPKHAYAFKREKKQGRGERFIRIAVQCASLASADSDSIMRRGSTCAALIDELEKMGYRVELDAVFQSDVRRDSSVDTITIQLKRSNERLSMAKVAFVLAHPASMRRISFAIKERFTNERHSVAMTQCGYGSTRKQLTNRVRDAYDAVLDASTSGTLFNSDESATKWILKQVDEINAKFADDNETK